MRFATFGCVPYGPFEDLRLTFPPAEGDLQVLCGANEAGKSSLLRAMLDFLFGIPPRTPDSFRFGYPSLALEATFDLADGSQVGARRQRKGQQSELVPLKTAPVLLTSIQLADLLGGFRSDRSFRAVCALTYDQLKEANRMLRDSGGEAGISLASASLGTQVLDVLKSLQAEAEDLYKPRGSAQKISELQKQRTAEQRVKQEATLRASEWKRLEQDLTESSATVDKHREAVSKLQQETRRLERAGRIAPLLHKEQTLAGQLQSLVHIPLLPGDFSGRWSAATTERTGLQKQFDSLRHEMASTSRELESFPDDFPLLAGDLPERIDTLYQQLENYRRLLDDHPKRELELANLQREVASLRERLPAPLRDQQVTVDVVQESDLQQLIQQAQAGRQQQRMAEAAVRDGESQLEQAKRAFAQLVPPGEIEVLQQALQATRDLPETEANLRSLRSRSPELQDVCDVHLQALRFEGVTSESLPTLTLPADSLLEEAQQLQQQISDGLREAEKELRRITKEERECAASIAQLERQGEVPLLADLEAARTHREAGWQVVRHAWLQDPLPPDLPEVWQSPADLPEAYESAVESADQIADALRAHADLVQQRHALDAESARITAIKEYATSEVARLTAVQEAAQESWRALWHPAGLTPDKPSVMREWTRRVKDYQQAHQALARLRGEIEQCRQQAEAARATLVAALKASGVTVSDDAGPGEVRAKVQDLVEQALAFRSKQEERQEQVEAATTRLRSTQDELQCAAEAHAIWQEAWSRVLTPLGLPATTGPEAVAALLEAIRDLRPREVEVAKAQERSAKIVRDIQEFEASATSTLSTQLGDATQGPSLAQRIATIYRQQQQQLKDQATRANLQTRLRELETRRSELEEQLARCHRDIAQLLTEAGASEESEVADRLTQSQERRDIESAYADTQRLLRETLDGRPVEYWQELIADRTVDELSLMFEEAETTLEAEQDALNRARDRRTLADKALQDASHRQGALAAAGRVAGLEHEMRSLVADYLRLKLAASLLQSTIDALQASQGNRVVDRGSYWFRRLTQGAFAGLDISGDSLQQIGAIRGDGQGKSLTPEQLSDGTRDQLFLALRLAMMEQYCQQREPLPLILDDLLITFDDARTGATLSALAEFSSVTQVLLFTHHEHVASLAAPLPGARVHRL